MHRLFFAIRPDARAAAAATASGVRLRAEHRLKTRGRPLSSGNLHVTMHWLRDHDSLPADLLAAAMVAGAGVEVAPFDVLFDRGETLRGPDGGGPLVLTGTAGMAELRDLQRALGASMVEAGIGHLVRSAFKPHMTLLYADGAVAAQAIDPIRWTVNELLLIDSVVGESRHIELGRWALRGRQLTFGGW